MPPASLPSSAAGQQEHPPIPRGTGLSPTPRTAGHGRRSRQSAGCRPSPSWSRSLPRWPWPCLPPAALLAALCLCARPCAARAAASTSSSYFQGNIFPCSRLQRLAFCSRTPLPGPTRPRKAGPLHAAAPPTRAAPSCPHQALAPHNPTIVPRLHRQLPPSAPAWRCLAPGCPRAEPPRHRPAARPRRPGPTSLIAGGGGEGINYLNPVFMADPRKGMAGSPLSRPPSRPPSLGEGAGRRQLGPCQKVLSCGAALSSM